MSTLRWRIILPSLLLPWYGAMAASPPGQLVWWGHNPWGETTVTASSALASGFVTIGGQVLSNVVAVAGGGDQALALRSDGTVICGGGGRGGVRAGLTNVVAISTSGTVSLALKRDGSVVVWGDGSQNLPSAPDLADVVAVSAGAGHCLALTRDGTVVAWGNPWRKPGLVRGVPAGLSNVVAIAATHSAYGRDLALKSDGSVVEWSLRGSIQVGPLGPTVTNEVGEVGELVKLAELRVVEDLSDVAAVAAAEDSGMFGGVWFILAL